MLRILILLALFTLASCFGKVSSRDPEKVNDVMITFITKAKSGFWNEAMANITPEERDDMMDGNGQVYQEYKDAINRLRLSTFKNMDIGLDNKGRLVGIKDALDESNDFYKFSDEKVVIDPSKLKDLSIERIERERAEAEEKLKKEKRKDDENEDGNETEEEDDDGDPNSFLEKLLKETPTDM